MNWYQILQKIGYIQRISEFHMIPGTFQVKFYIHNQIPGWKLRGEKYSKPWYCLKRELISREILGRFQEWWTFGILHWKSRSLTQTEWENTPYVEWTKFRGLQDFLISKFQASKIKRYSKRVQNYYIRSNWYQIW